MTNFLFPGNMLHGSRPRDHCRDDRAAATPVFLTPGHFEGRCPACSRGGGSGAHTALRLECGQERCYPLLHTCCFPNPGSKRVPVTAANLAHIFKCYNIRVEAAAGRPRFSCDETGVAEAAIIDLASQHGMRSSRVARLLERQEDLSLLSELTD